MLHRNTWVVMAVMAVLLAGCRAGANGKPRPAPEERGTASAASEASSGSVNSFLLSPSRKAARVTAIKAGRLLDTDKGTASTDQIILIEGSRIKAVGRDVKIPQGAEVIDLSNATVLPGLFDCHTHMCTGINPPAASGSDFRAVLDAILTMTVTKTTTYRALEGVANCRDMLLTGFTTVRDVGNAMNYGDTDLRRALENGLIPGPTMINAGRIITPFGGQYSDLSPERRGIGKPEYFYADTRDELKKAIRENIHYGAQLIKIVVDDQPYIYSVEDIKFIVAEAARAGRKVAAHAITTQGSHNAILGGVASVEHGPNITDEDLLLMKRNNVVLVGTDFTHTTIRHGGMKPEWHGVYIDRLRRAYKLDVTIAFGTDVFIANVEGHNRGTLSLEFIESFIEAGVPPPAILKTMTANAARLCGVEKERGAIRPGLAADIIATPGNPFEDIRALNDVTFVMKDGRVFKRQ